MASGVSVMGSSLITEPAQGLFSFAFFIIISYMGFLFLNLVKSNSFIGVERLEFKPDGYNFWTWRGHRIHYVVQGEGFPIVLIHGFGASAFHWRFVSFDAHVLIFRLI